jgi:hypothetical protein
MTILFKLRIPCFHDRPAEPQILGFAPPDFLLNLMALPDLMRLSLRERRTPDRGGFSVAGNPGREDKKERAAVRKEWLLTEGFQNQFGQLFSLPRSTSSGPSVRD